MTDVDPLTKRYTLFDIPIWEMNFAHHNDHVKDLIECIYKTVNLDPYGVSKSNFNGYQSNNITSNIVFAPLFRFIMQELKIVLQDLGMLNCSAEIRESWFNINKKHSINSIHSHTSTFSGVYYLKANKHSGKICFVNLAMMNSWNGFTLSNQRIGGSISDTTCFNPVEGKILIWQSHIPHYVLPNNDDEDRISISFNVDVQKDRSI